MSTPEGVIQTHIIKYLRDRGVFCWPVKNAGTFDAKRGLFRRPHPTFMKGVSDIHGIYNCRALAIEVKTKTGRLTPEQKLFLQRHRENGGIAMVARCVEDVQEGLAKWRAIA